MRYNIGIYASNDWTGAKAYADHLRSEEPCTVRIRDGSLFTLDQREDFDVVFVKGDFPAVMEAYPDAHRLEEFPGPGLTEPKEDGDKPEGEGDAAPEASDAADEAPKPDAE